jgi:sugar O-acyltransferase (sialic acid O-acetyltransferase NeuD family)
MMDERNVDVQVPTARAPRPVSPPSSGIAHAAVTAAAGPVPPAHRRRGNRKRVLLVLHYYDYRHHSGVARYAAQAGWALEDAYTMIRSLPDSWDGDGIISFHGPSPQFIDWCKRAAERVPVVDIGEYEEYSDLPRVTTDTARIAEVAVEHFAARGYRNVGFTWAFDNPFKAKRLAAARRAAEARGLNFFDVPLDEIPTLGRRRALPIALLATNDAAAVRALPSGARIVLGIGAPQALRAAIVARWAEHHARWTTVVHARAVVSPLARLEPGAVVLACAVVNPCATIGAHAIVNSGSIIEHHSTVGAFAHVAPGAVIGGGASVGEAVHVGLGAAVRDHVTIGRRATVGMGASVVHPVDAEAVVVGVPARRKT